MDEEMKENIVSEEELEEVSGGYWTDATAQLGAYRCRQWVVQPGESLKVIGKLTQCNWMLIAQLNGISTTNYLIKAGQRLWIPY